MLKSTDLKNESEMSRVKVLSEALPYIQKFTGRKIVVKYGGAAMRDSNVKDQVMRDIVLLSCVGIRPIVVHGGGPEINSWLGKLGIEPQFKDGLRVTDASTMQGVIEPRGNCNPTPRLETRYIFEKPRFPCLNFKS